MRKVLGCPSKTPKHLMYLELGWLPLRFIIKSRRLNFLKYILNQTETSLVKQVFNEQKLNPKRGDWVKDVEKDLKKLKICLTYDEITSMSKSSFKTLVKQKCEECGLEYLKKHIKSKGKEMVFMHIEMRNYLSSNSTLTIQEKKEAFLIRTRMTEVKTNFKNQYMDYNCIVCEKENMFNEETQEHIYSCKLIKENNHPFKHIFKNSHETKEIKDITNAYIANMKQRKTFLP